MLGKLMSLEEEEVFFQDHFEKSPMILNRENSDNFSEILCNDEVDKIFSSWDLKNLSPEVIGKEDFDLFDGETDRDSCYKLKSTRGGIKELFRLYGDGYPLKLNNMQKNAYPIREVCSILENVFFSLAPRAVVYLFPCISRFSIKRGAGDMDAFLFQISGNTQLRISRNEQGKMQGDKDSDSQGLIEQDLVFSSGGLAYIPKAYSIDMQAEEQSSAKTLLIEFSGLSVKDFLSNLVMQLAKLHENVDFRRSIPLSWVKAGKMLDESDRETQEAKKILGNLRSFLKRPENIQQLRKQLSSWKAMKAKPLLKRQLLSIHSLKHLSVNSEIQMRATAYVSMTTGPEELTWKFCGSSSSFPLNFEEGLKGLMSGAEVRVRDIKGDMLLEEKFNMAKMLVSEGSFEIISHELS
ncbi:MAG: hypothetical protein ACI9S8_001150 [Chlamydiales bacterium]|jgi:hypothetical protein